MFAKIQQLVKESVIYGVGTIAPRVVNFLLLPFYSHLMPPAEYADYALFMLLTTFLMPLYIHGMDIAYLRFTARAGIEEKRHHLGAMLVHTAIVGGSVSVLMWLVAPWAATLMVSGSGATGEAVVRMIALIILLDTLSTHIYNWLRIQSRPISFSGVRMLNVLANIGFNIVLVGVYGMGVLGIFYAYLGASAITLLVLLVVAWRAIALGWSWPMIKQWLLFGLPNLPSQLFLVILEFSDRKWIELYMTQDDVGLYSAGYRVAMLMSLIAVAFRYAWQPFFLKNAEDEQAREIFARVLTYFLLFSGWVWVASTFFLPDLLKLPLPWIGALIDPRYWAGFEVVPVVMLAHIFSGVYATFMAGVYLKNKTGIIPVAIGTAAAVNVVGNMLLIPVYGYMASAWLTVASYVTMTVILFVYIRTRYEVPYEWGRVTRIALSVVAVWGLAQPFEGVAGGWLRAVLLIVLPGLWWVWVLGEDERRGVRRRLARRTS